MNLDAQFAARTSMPWRIARLKYKADIEVRLITVPEDYVPSKPGTFVPQVMDSSPTSARRMGADPKSWRTEAP